MTGEIFYWVFNMSVAASVTGLIVAAIRSFPRIPKRIAEFLWIVPVFRMCVPVGLNAPFSLMALLSRLTTKTVTVYEPADWISFSTMNMVQLAGSYHPVTYKVNALETVFSVASVVWLVGAAAALVTLFTIYAVTMREIRDSRPAGDGVFFSDKVTTPAVYGVIKPKIVLPSSFEGRDLSYIILHEKTHIRRGDNLKRLVFFCVAAVHWFNPVSWILLKLYLSDLELACDEVACSGLDGDGRRGYAAALLECAGGKTLFASAFGGAKVKTRIENVLSFRKMTVLSAVLFAALAAVIVFVLITNAG